MQSKINDLIQNEVSSGQLTSTQASELKGIFQASFAQGPGGPAPGRGHRQHVGDGGWAAARKFGHLVLRYVFD